MSIAFSNTATMCLNVWRVTPVSLLKSASFRPLISSYFVCLL